MIEEGSYWKIASKVVTMQGIILVTKVEKESESETGVWFRYLSDILSGRYIAPDYAEMSRLLSVCKPASKSDIVKWELKR